jgi:SAM-dependent methyltransferase
MNHSYTGDHILDLFSRFAKKRNKYIFKLIEKCLPADRTAQISILEFGAGKGEFIKRFLGKNGVKACAVEIENTYRRELSINLPAFEKLEDVPGNPDLIFLIDVLEHLEDDIQYLRDFKYKLKKGGGLFIYVPARMELYSAFDKSIGHYRRYSKNELIEKVRQAGFTVHYCHYHEMLGYPVSYIHNKLFGKTEPTAFSIQLYDRLLIPSTNFLERLFNPPIGKSLYIFARS